MKNCNTCLYGNQGFCTMHHTVPGGCNDYVQNIPMDDLIELQEYRKIGTVEECREAVEKTKPKEPEIIPLKDGTKYLKCPNCKLTTVIYNNMIVGYCPKCGQKLEE